MDLVRLDPAEWNVISKDAHMISFGEIREPELNRIDYALLVVGPEKPLQWMTLKEQDAESVYIQHGGSTPEILGTPASLRAFNMALRYLKQHYKRVSFLVENRNKPMLKLAMKTGFIITGIRYFKDSILLEHLLEE